MSLTRLEVSNFRCLSRAELDLDPRVTVIAGPNASGKTALLEAIFFLSCGRSFRTSRVAPLIRNGQSETHVLGRVSVGARRVLLAAAGSRAGIETRVAGESVRGFAEHARLLPVQAIDPEIHKVLEEGPARRRRYVDWGVFHVERGYVAVWRRYQRALKQRNAALKQRLPQTTVELWDRELVDAAESLSQLRERYLASLTPIAAGLVFDLLHLDLELFYHRGWPQERSLAEALHEARSRDAVAGVTSVGPHRADVVVRVDGLPARDRVSRGQQKLLAAALVLAQVEQRAESGAETTLLIDDPAAELDAHNLNGFLARVAKLPAQLVITALDPKTIAALPIGRLFHVERATVQQMI